MSLGCRDTLNIVWGCFLSFLRSVSAALFTLCLDAGTIISFFRGCSIFSECVYLIGSLLVFTFFLFCLSLLSTFYWWFFASASETNRSSLTVFFITTGAGEGIYRGRGRGNSKLQKDKRTTKPESIQHCYKGWELLVWSGDTEG